MYAITLHQPWASLIALGLKTVETRSWPAPSRLVGHTIAIHAAKRVVRPPGDPIDQTMRAHLGEDWRRTIPAGAVLATAVLSMTLENDTASNRSRKTWAFALSRRPAALMTGVPWSLGASIGMILLPACGGWGRNGGSWRSIRMRRPSCQFWSRAGRVQQTTREI